MTKYNIEGGIDFYSELYKSLDIEDDSEQDNNICLITNEPLIDNYVTLDCGHKFNYNAIYNDILNHKYKFNGMESTKLNKNQIRCPYCRKKQNKVLPYYEELGFKKVNGVNYFDPNNTEDNDYNNIYSLKKCQFKFLNDNYDPDKPETETNSKYSNSIICVNYGNKINLYNNLNPHEPITYGDNNSYCYFHKKIMIKHYKLQEKQKIKEALKAAKQKEKKEALIAKELIKQKEKEAKQKEKEAVKIIKKIPVENKILGPSNVLIGVSQNEGCIAILKSGPNKGNLCGCKIINENLCRRHSKLIM